MIRQYGQYAVRSGAFLLLASLLTACDAEPSGGANSSRDTQHMVDSEQQQEAITDIPLEEIYRSQQCSVSERALRVVESADQLVQVKAAQLNLQGTEPAEEAVDFARDHVVLVAQGQQNSAGYGVELTSRIARVRNGVVELPVEFSAPPKDAFTAQVMTSPCLVLAFPKNFGEARLRSVTAGDLRAELENGSAK